MYTDARWIDDICCKKYNNICLKKLNYYKEVSPSYVYRASNSSDNAEAEFSSLLSFNDFTGFLIFNLKQFYLYRTSSAIT